ncbi:class I SAM-dependent methyltransferase [Limnospira platensis]|uniref:class I SAM-dependent methyltransferase n=1 Tax=Limnospira platensis TaxID=118562 RepID=UPI003D6EE482
MKKEKVTLLVSRFNCPHPVWENKTREEYLSWLHTRLDLFARYTFKSYQNLNTKPDQWLLLVDQDKLDQETFSQLSDLIAGEKCQLVQYQSNLRLSILEYLISTYGVSNFPSEVRTTRLDTDDIISKDFFDKINSVVLEKNTSQLLISFPGGANYDSETGLFYYSSYPENPFITLCHKNQTPNEFKCVYDQMHTVFHKVAQKNLYIRTHTPMWCSVIHTSNLANHSLRQANKLALVSESCTNLIFGIDLITKEKTMHYKEFLSAIHNRLKPKYYVEIGIRQGAALGLSKAMSIGIDPNFTINVEIPSFVKLFRCTSDDFFQNYNLRSEFNNQSCQLSFIDGLHLFEYALRDFRNIETYCEPESVVIFDDVRPRNKKEAERKQTGGAWTGDIWKIYYCLKKYRPDLKLSLLQTQPTGLLLVTNLDSNNRNLWDSYDQIIEEFLSPEFPVYPKEDYFQQFTMPEDFLNSDTFSNIKSFFDKKFSGVGVATYEDQGCQGQPTTQKVVKQYRQQLQDMMTTLEGSSGKYQEAIAKLEKLKASWSEREQQ